MEAGIVFFLTASILISQNLKMDYPVAKLMSFLLLCLIIFFFSFFFPFRYVFYFLFAIFLISGIYRAYRDGFNFEFRYEAVFLAVFLYFLFLRFLIPQAYGAEKIMDYAFLNSVLRADMFHPPDPFFAGGVINFYYYFGYVFGAAVTLSSLLSLSKGFNVAIAVVPAYFAMLSYYLIRRICDCNGGRSRIYSVIALIFAVFSGNFYAFYEFLKDIIRGTKPGYLFYWNATRIIDDSTYGKTINEFPYFSFIHADFHAHFVALPVKVLAIIILYDYFKKGKNWVYLIPLNFILFAVNSWDAPIFLFITFLTALYRFYSTRDVAEIKKGAIVLALSAISILTLYSTMETPSAKPFLTGERTSLTQFFLYFGIIFILSYIYLYDEIVKSKRLAMLSVLAGILAYPFIPIFPVIFPLTILSARKFLRGDYLSMLIFSATLIVLACEFVAVESRMNTFFKFYLAAWVLLLFPSAIAIAKSLKGSGMARYLVLTVFLISLVYPVIATPIKYYRADFSLDSEQFIKYFSEGDYEAIQFLKDKRGVVLEAYSDCYGYSGRVAAFSGNPTVIAWGCHEVQWRDNPDELVERIRDVRTIYTTNNCTLAKLLAKKYNVSYIFVGYEEHRVYGVSELKCFREVFKSGDAVVYSVNNEN
ncbi:Chlor_Arch_YYY domain protein [Archaeoglobus sulfaticallidus PM70-1]|uniref:Chlor_Arch_YYY domain protein n=1 Tax=Archaeoglobus sulfaticallidus PM70-1 TaxID=387631 RepID=N0BF70_9EURY|nr:DUF2298 domain-containing protein [Archaeoglobus sulfaticallidus]AGK61668.1 Chlor_Arch_YYY domain protein [Archaeoglobus sulfaticallidus PM70-1]